MASFRPLVLLAWCGCGGQEVQLRSLQPEVAISPAALDFGDVVANSETAVLPLFIDNSGRANLLATLAFEGDDAAMFSADVDELELAPGDSTQVRVSFAPAALRAFSATLVVASNDPDDALLPSTLTGAGRVPYAPDIELRPSAQLDLGSVDVGDTKTGFFEVFNAGDALLVLGSVTQSGAGTFTLVSDPSGDVVPPAQARAVLVEYAPVQPAGDSGQLTIASNDADEPEVVLDLLANGGGLFAYPQAVIACPGPLDLDGPVSVALDGTGSSDPDGLPLTYAWAIVRSPAAADPTRQPEPADTPESTLLIDVAGTWEVSLTVANDRVPPVPSVPAKCVIEAVPADDVHIEVSWAGPTADFDLHLAQGDTPFFETPGDASFCNPFPAWGARLDVDDSDGFGPENINIATPADGTYAVRVHHFDDGDDGAVTGTVQVFTYGTLAWQGSAVLARNEVWEVGQVNWPTGTFGVSTEPPWDAGGTRECR